MSYVTDKIKVKFKTKILKQAALTPGVSGNHGPIMGQQDKIC